MLKEGKRRDLSKNMKYTKLPKGLKLLQMRMWLYTLPFFNVWPQRAMYLYLGYSALSALGFTDWVAAHALGMEVYGDNTVGEVLQPVMKEVSESVGKVTKPVGEGFSRVFGLTKAPLKFAGRHFSHFYSG